MANAGQCASALRLQGSSRAVATPMESVNSVLKTLSPAPRHTQVGYELEICPDCAMGTYGLDLVVRGQCGHAAAMEYTYQDHTSPVRGFLESGDGVSTASGSTLWA